MTSSDRSKIPSEQLYPTDDPKRVVRFFVRLACLMGAPYAIPDKFIRFVFAKFKTMKKSFLYGAVMAVLTLVGACEKPVQPQQPVDPQQKPDQGFVEAVPDTVKFTNADFIYYGDIAG